MSGKTIRETLGFLVVVASLVFVGMEIRQNTIAARAAAYQAIGIATAAVFDNQAHDRQFIMSVQGKEPAAMDTTDWRQFHSKLTAIARLGCHRRRVQRGCRGLGPVPRGHPSHGLRLGPATAHRSPPRAPLLPPPQLARTPRHR